MTWCAAGVRPHWWPMAAPEPNVRYYDTRTPPHRWAVAGALAAVVVVLAKRNEEPSREPGIVVEANVRHFEAGDGDPQCESAGRACDGPVNLAMSVTTIGAGGQELGVSRQ